MGAVGLWRRRCVDAFNMDAGADDCRAEFLVWKVLRSFAEFGGLCGKATGRHFIILSTINIFRLRHAFVGEMLLRSAIQRGAMLIQKLRPRFHHTKDRYRWRWSAQI